LYGSRLLELLLYSHNLLELLLYGHRAQFTRWLNQLEKQYSMKITQTQMTHSNIQSLSNFAEQIRIDSDSTLPAPTAQIKSELGKISVNISSIFSRKAVLTIILALSLCNLLDSLDISMLSIV